jgi:type IV pilus assembly protein PilM
MQRAISSSSSTGHHGVRTSPWILVIPGLDEMVQSRTQINTLVANPFANMAISPRIQLKKLVADAPSLMVACGLALRRFDP